MSETDFELYLQLLSRFLRLTPDQHSEIADELRDHLESRLEELVRSGLPREQAIRRALDEFGDAAHLADHFTLLARQRRRRIIMRCALGTSVAAAAAVLLFMAFIPLPHGPNAPAQIAAAVAQERVAQEAVAQEKQPLADKSAAGAPTAPNDEVRREIERALDTKRMNASFEETPLRDVLEVLGDEIGADVFISRRHVQVDPEMPITLKITRRQITARAVLELVLEQLDLPVGYEIRDGVIYLTDPMQVSELQVYDCRELLREAAQGAFVQPLASRAGETPAKPDAQGPAPAPGLPAPPTTLPATPGSTGIPLLPIPAPVAMGGFGGGAPEVGRNFELTTPGRALIEVIRATIDPDSWRESGGFASIEEFNGLLVVKHNQQKHREIRQLLEMMRAGGSDKAITVGGARPSGGGFY